MLDTDASEYGIGAVLSQKQEGEERVIAYASRCQSKEERNYCVTRKELLAVKYFVEYFHHYLVGRPFLLRTDHSALTWLQKKQHIPGQFQRWYDVLQQYTYTFQHRPGINHGNADALSRRPCDCKVCVRSDPTENKVEHCHVITRAQFHPLLPPSLNTTGIVPPLNSSLWWNWLKNNWQTLTSSLYYGTCC